jgi:hypothetical protein
MEGFFYAKIEAFEVQVYSDSPVDLESDAVIYLGLSDEAYPRAELWFVDRAKADRGGTDHGQRCFPGLLPVGEDARDPGSAAEPRQRLVHMG